MSRSEKTFFSIVLRNYMAHPLVLSQIFYTAIGVVTLVIFKTTRRLCIRITYNFSFFWRVGNTRFQFWCWGHWSRGDFNCDWIGNIKSGEVGSVRAAWWRAARGRFLSLGGTPVTRSGRSGRRRASEGSSWGSKGVGGTLLAKGAVQFNFCSAATGG